MMIDARTRFSINSLIEKLSQDGDRFPADTAKELIRAIPLTTKLIAMRASLKHTRPGTSFQGATNNGASASAESDPEEITHSIGNDGRLIVGGYRIEHDAGRLDVYKMWDNPLEDNNCMRLVYDEKSGAPLRIMLSSPKSFTIGPLKVCYGQKWTTWKTVAD